MAKLKSSFFYEVTKSSTPPRPHVDGLLVDMER